MQSSPLKRNKRAEGNCAKGEMGEGYYHRGPLLPRREFESQAGVDIEERTYMRDGDSIYDQTKRGQGWLIGRFGTACLKIG